MRKPIVLHQCLLLTWCAFALLPRGVSPRLLVGGLEDSTGPSGTTDPYADTATESTDLSLNFESATPGDESFETTTNVNFAPGPGAGKTGRHFGGRLGGKNSSSNRNNIVFPSLRARPTTPNYNRVVKRRKNPLVNSTHLKGWNGSVEVATGPVPETSTTIVEDTPTTSVRVSSALAAGTTTSQNPLLNRRRTLAELRNSRPTAITVTDTTTSLRRSNVPLLKTTVETEVETDSPGIEPESSNMTPVEASAVRPLSPPPPPGPSASANSISGFSLYAEPVSNSPIYAPSENFVTKPPLPAPTVTSESGIYHFRYTTTLPTSSRVIHAEEFGITRESYGDEDEDSHPVTPTEDQQEEPPTTWRSTGLFPTGRTTIQSSEEDFSTPTSSPGYRDYFENGKVRSPGLSVKFEEPVAVSSVATPPLSASTTPNDQSQPILSERIIEANPRQRQPTPSLPSFIENPTPSIVPILNKIDQSSSSTTKEAEPIAINSTTSNAISHEEPHEENHHHHHKNNQEHFNGNVNGIFITSSSRVTVNSSVAMGVTDNKVAAAVDEAEHVNSVNSGESVNNAGSAPPTISPTPTISTREFKSTYFTSAEHPLYTVSSYSYSSSTEYSFFVPEDHLDHGHDHSNGNHHHDDGSDHDHENETEHQHSDDLKQKEPQELRPTTSTLSYWDTLGLKSVDPSSHFNTSKNTPSPSPSPSPSPAGDLESSFSTPEAKTSVLPPLTTPRPPTVVPVPSSSEENESNVYFEDGESTETGNMTPTRSSLIPEVPFLIQISLDMEPSMFCTKIPIFKDMIVMVYQDSFSNVSSEQVVVFNEPKCDKISNSTRAGSSPLIEKKKSSAPVPSVSTQIISTGGSENNRKKNNKTKRALPYVNPNGNTTTITTDLYSVYVYLTDKNGTYDQMLTESFIDLWNGSSRADENSTFFDKIKKVEMISSTQSITGDAPTNENAGIIAAITIAGIAAVCLLVIAVLLLLMRHRQAKTKFAKRCTPVTLDDYSLDNISVFNSFRRKQRTRASKRSYTNAGFEDHNAPSKPLNAAALLSLSIDLPSLSEEFILIPNVNPTLDDIPNGAETKNRFANVIPMPDSRVLLTFQDEQPNSDYINANFARGVANTNKAYIITQGPLDETVVDFWRMIWEQQVRVIIMLTDFAEAGIPKCAEYYPRSETLDCSQLHGDFQITLEKRDVTENCITSNLVIKDMDRSLRRDVVHLWYHSWPEKGVPAHAKNTADFLIKSRKYTKEPCPVVVHCSPGTGRSGTLVACDIGMKELESLHSVDIPQIVKKLRQDRAGAVQTKEQYKHIYEVLQYYATKLSSTQLDSV